MEPRKKKDSIITEYDEETGEWEIVDGQDDLIFDTIFGDTLGEDGDDDNDEEEES